MQFPCSLPYAYVKPWIATDSTLHVIHEGKNSLLFEKSQIEKFGCIICRVYLSSFSNSRDCKCTPCTRWWRPYLKVDNIMIRVDDVPFACRWPQWTWCVSSSGLSWRCIQTDWLCRLARSSEPSICCSSRSEGCPASIPPKHPTQTLFILTSMRMPSQCSAKIYNNHYLDAWIATSTPYNSNSELVTDSIWSDKKHFYLDNRCHRLLWALTWHIVVTRSVVDDVPKSQRQYDDKRQTEDDDSCGDDATAATPRRRIVLRLQSRNNTFLTFKWSYCVYFARRVEKNNIRRLLLINFDSLLNISCSRDTAKLK